MSFIGYETQELPLTEPDNALTVTLRPSAVLDQVVVAASRVEENIGQVPVTVEKLNQRQVEQITTPDLVAGLGRFKGIDISSSSLLTTSFSTRGFNSSRSERVIQLADYMDTQVPSLSSNFGNLLGMPVLDVASVEIVHGPASALYGANAFNGVLLTNSKDPFKDPGLTVRLRGGNRNLLDGQLRYAVKIGERVAFKISGGATVADDFFAENQDATSSLIEPANNPAGSVAGYDAVSRYGDVGAITFGQVLINPATGAPYRDGNGNSIPTPTALVGKTLFLPGYTERELVAGDNKTHSYKVAPSLAVLLSNSVKATIDYKYTEASTTYQSASRYRFLNGGAHQGRVQVEGRNWFVRAFTTQDFSGARDPLKTGSYNLGFLGGFLQNQLIPGSTSTTYAQRYVGTYLGTLAARLAGGQAPDASVQAAIGAAAPTLLQPGTAEFDAARNQIIHDPTPGKGARLIIRSILNEGSGQYTYRNNFADLTMGAAYRQFLLGSDGSLFEDKKDGDRIVNYEYGAYAQASKTLLDDHLKLAAAGRVDRFQNFGTAFSPRASAVYSMGADKQQNFRLSFSRAFRAPTQNDQYIRLDVGRAILLGNVRGGFEGYSTALGAKLSADPGILAPSRSADLAAYRYSSAGLKLEEVNSTEVGYRAQFGKNVYVDVDYFYNTYNNFIATQNFIGNIDGSQPTTAQIGAAAGGRFQNSALNTRVIQIASNVDQRVQSHGAGLTLAYAVAPALTLNGNYSYNDLITKEFKAGTQSFFNTPRHKFNLGFDGQALDRKLSYNVNYRWVAAFLYESTFATGTVPQAQTVDAQVGYTLKSLHTTLQAGATNLFDAPNLQVYGAPSIGRIGYVGLLFDIK
ncbi:TonB-dependent receptor plug domain-containing protein [Hymenobacter sp. BT770]|uniref:TonB-dependent receptor plug domain-containing protein n=1 Tax=Hymenobacter sp. BT770 TaxID=2886942 RepID=UPI001D1011D1|nr:TonB-dependent receptor [Hymenobacter sp. BT770]MCC3154092.1 TonB-dependent receptor plug domain-containing protein [Hymenobacter sp. BT770]MDO3416236.1 TonB-dependent receptor plug domain-containing protein [Hymenobacter sp. BT770]